MRNYKIVREMELPELVRVRDDNGTKFNGMGKREK